MKDVKEAVYGVLINDDTLQTLLGGDANDKRVHFWHPDDEIKITESKPAYIVFYEGASPEPHIKLEKIRIIIDIFARKADKAEDVFARVDALLDDKELTCSGHDNILTRRISMEDAWNPGGVHGKSVTYEVEVTPK